MTNFWMMIALMGSLAAWPAGAQQRGKDSGQDNDVPKSHRPPPGMCRVWLDDVPPGQQPASTDCKSALRSKPAKARVIFGDDYVDTGKRRDPSLKGFKNIEKKPAEAKGPRWRKP